MYHKTTSRMIVTFDDGKEYFVATNGYDITKSKEFALVVPTNVAYAAITYWNTVARIGETFMWVNLNYKLAKE